MPFKNRNTLKNARNVMMFYLASKYFTYNKNSTILHCHFKFFSDTFPKFIRVEMESEERKGKWNLRNYDKLKIVIMKKKSFLWLMLPLSVLTTAPIRFHGADQCYYKVLRNILIFFLNRYFKVPYWSRSMNSYLLFLPKFSGNYQTHYVTRIRKRSSIYGTR